MKRKDFQNFMRAQLGACGVYDANESIAFSRELEHFISEVYEIEFVGLAAMDLFPEDPDKADAADTTYTTRQVGTTGAAEFVSDWSTDAPAVSFSVKGENNYPIRSVRNRYLHTIQDLRTAQKVGRPLSMKLADAAKRAHGELFEQVAFFGDANYLIKGLFSSAEVVANSTAKVGAAWDTNPATLVDIVLNDVDNMWSKIFTDTKGLYVADTLAVSTEVMKLLTTPRSLGTGNGYGSLYNLIKSTYQDRGGMNIVHAQKLDIGTTGAAGGLPRQVMYKKDARVLSHQTPVLFEQVAPIPRGLAIEINCHSRIGGVHVERPKAITYLDGAVT